MKIITALMFLFVSVLLSGCDNENDPAPGHVKVFMTSASYDGNFAGAPVTFDPALDGADAACNTAATNGGLTGTWTAWLSDNDTDAADRINNGSGAPYQLINGTVIASNFSDLTDGTLAAPISIDESGNTVGGATEVWTATAADGINPGVGSCQEWTTNDVGARGQIGHADAVDATWTDAGGGNTCDSFNRLYCFADANSN